MIALFESHQSLLVCVGLTLTHFLWQGLVLAALLAVVLRLLRGGSAQVRYVACGLTLVAMVACVPATYLLMDKAYPPGFLVRAHSMKWTQQAGNAQVDRADATPNRMADAEAKQALRSADDGESSLVARTFVRSGELSPAKSGAERPDSREPAGMPIAVDGYAGAPSKSTNSPSVSASWWHDHQQREYVLAIGLSIAAVLWAVGVVILGLRLIGGWAVLRRWQHEAEAISDSLSTRVWRSSAALGLRKRPDIRVSTVCTQPLAFGLLRPIVLLPIAAVTELPTELLEAMIAHELAHIRRHDLWVNLLQRVAEIVLFYHPAVWWVSGRMRLERELCCDDLAVKATGRRVEYAESLVALAKRSDVGSAAALAVGMFGSRTTLAARIRRVLQLPAPPERTRAWLAGPLSVIIVAAIVIAAAVAPSISRARATAAETVKPTTQPTSASPITTMIRLNFANVPLEKAIMQFAEQAGRPLLGLDEMDPASKFKVLNLVIPQPLPFDDALTTFDIALFRQTPGFWIAVGEHGLVLHQLTEWYRYIPPENWFGSPAEYQAAKVPGWAVAKVHYQPKGDVEAVANLVIDAIPVNGARAMVAPDGTSFDLAGFAYFIDRQLAILAKRDVEGMSRAQTRALRAIQAGDWLNIQMYSLGSPQSGSNLSQTVDENGDIYVPIIGKVAARGLAPSALRDKLLGPVAKLYADAMVLVEFARDADSHGPPGRPVPGPRANSPKSPTPTPAVEKAGEAENARMKEELEKENVRMKEERRRILGPSPAPPLDQADRSEYRIESGDQLNIHLLNPHGGTDAAIPTVDQSGDIDLFQIGKIAAMGLTTSALREKIISQAKTKGLYAADAKPEVTVRILRSAADRLKQLKQEERSVLGMAQRSLPVRSMTDGIISEVLVQSGQHVKKGDVLIRFDDEEIRFELEKAQITLAVAAEQMRIYGTSRDFMALAAKKKADADVQMAKMDVKRLENRLARTRITSPADGIVQNGHSSAADLKTSVGIKLSAGDEILILLADPPATQPQGSDRAAQRSVLGGRP